MKRILLSLIILSSTAALAVGVSRAFFSDRETSTGNTFTAGSINLDDSLSTKVFNLADMKPGDMGSGKYDIKATSNNYWACMKSTIDTKPENDVLEMETVAGDTAANGAQDGELQGLLYFYVWNDRDGDGVYTGDGTSPDPNIYPNADRNLVGPLTLVQLEAQGSLPLEDSTSQSFFGPSPLVAGTTYNLGYAYCFGTLSVDTSAKKLICSVAGDQNIAQTDGVTGTTKFYAVQSDNNAEFVCSSATY